MHFALIREAHLIACSISLYTNKEIPFIVQKICFYFLHYTINDVTEVSMLLKNIQLLRVQYTTILAKSPWDIATFHMFYYLLETDSI